MIQTSLASQHSPTFIHTLSGLYVPVGSYFPNSGVGIAEAAWPTANLAIYVPMNIPFNYAAKRAFVANGATTGGNFDLGIFSRAGRLIFSVGSTVVAGASVNQYATVDWLIPAGQYYFALSCSSATHTVLRLAATAITMRRLACLQQATQVPLAGPISAAAVANAFWPIFGVTTTTSGF